MLLLPLDFFYGLRTWPLATHAQTYSKLAQMECSSQLIKLTQSHNFFVILGNSWSVFPG